jgi:hypothetical protein
MNVGLVGAPAVVPGTDGLADPVEAPGRAWRGRACVAHEPRCGGRCPVDEDTGSVVGHDASIIGPEAKSLQGVSAAMRIRPGVRRQQPRPV